MPWYLIAAWAIFAWIVLALVVGLILGPIFKRRNHA